MSDMKMPETRLEIPNCNCPITLKHGKKPKPFVPNRAKFTPTDVSDPIKLFGHLTGIGAAIVDDRVGYRSDEDDAGQPPAKRRRLEDAASLPRMLAFKPSVTLLYRGSPCPAHIKLRSQTIRTHLFYSDEGAVHLELSTVNGKEDKATARLVCHKLDDADPAILEGILQASMLSHMYAVKKYEPSTLQGHIWHEIQLEMIPMGPAESALVVTWFVYWNTTISLENSPLQDRRRAPLLRALLRQHQLDGSFFVDSAGIPYDGLQTEIDGQFFYDSLPVPHDDNGLGQDEQAFNGLQTKLYPYQERSLGWMLKREGAHWSQSRHCLVEGEVAKLPMSHSFYKLTDANGQEFWISPALLIVTDRLRPETTFDNSSVRGGLLLEEMGLGKTLETIALIQLHRRQVDASRNIFDPYLSDEHEHFPIGATLVMCPEILIKQWVAEFSRHAPGLKVFIYQGFGNHSLWSNFKLLSHIADQDVVLVSFETLKRERYYMTRAVERSHRHETSRREQSPLISFSWWRSIVDEVQMVGGASTATAEAAAAISRVNAWGLSGTPVKDDVEGFRSLLRFLRYEPFGYRKPAFDSLKRYDRQGFVALCRHLAIRHTKHMVKSDFHLPKQTRYVMTIPFSHVEEQNYDDLFKAMCKDCGLGPEDVGVKSHIPPLRMERWLARLRRLALFPEPAKRGKTVGPRSLDDVLAEMNESLTASLHIAHRKAVSERIDRSKFLNGGFGIYKTKKALRVYWSALEQAESGVRKCRRELEEEMSRLDSDSVKIAKEEEEPVSATKQRLNHWLLLQHTAQFLCANGLYQVKSKLMETRPTSAQIAGLEVLEADGYEEAKKIRQELLHDNFIRCRDAIKALESKHSQIGGTRGLVVRQINEGRLPFESRSMITRLRAFMSVFNDYYSFLCELREKTVTLLCRKLVDAEDQEDVTGEEYENAARDQEYLSAYSHIYWIVTMNWDSMVKLGRVNPLAMGEAKTAKKLAKDGLGPVPDEMIGLLRKFDSWDNFNLSQVRDLSDQLSALNKSLKADRNQKNLSEVGFFHELETGIRAWTSELEDFVTSRKKESAEFSKLNNFRIDYYRQLQAISDLTADWETPSIGPRPHEDFQLLERAMLMRESETLKEISTLSSRLKYQQHLAKLNDEEEQLCNICTDPYENGSMTVCGHEYCKECLTVWLKSHQTCPTCKRKLSKDDVHHFTLKRRGIDAVEEMPPAFLGGLEENGVYAPLQQINMDAIKDIDLPGPPSTTKIDAICKHALWLRKREPDAKVIIFSQYREFLDLLVSAFASHGISSTSLWEKDGIETFRNVSRIQCFLMSAKTQSSGLNLVNASHVILCEPLINTSIELQAISRVHRIGQTRETTVWLYLIKGTVEENIYNISVRRRLENARRRLRAEGEKEEDLDEGLEMADSKEMQGGVSKKLLAPNKNGGEVVDAGDLWDCLFANRRRRGEYFEEEDLELCEPMVVD